MPLGVVQNLTMLLPSLQVSWLVWHMTPTKRESLPQPDSLAIVRETGNSEWSCKNTIQAAQEANHFAQAQTTNKSHRILPVNIAAGAW
jgi:hypothetical protein